MSVGLPFERFMLGAILAAPQPASSPSTSPIAPVGRVSTAPSKVLCDAGSLMVEDPQAHADHDHDDDSGDEQPSGATDQVSGGRGGGVHDRVTDLRKHARDRV